MMSGSLAKRVGIAFAVLGMLMLGGCWPKKKQAVINLLATKDSAPYSFKNQDSDMILGFEIDLLKHVAQKMGKELSVKSSDVPSILSSLGSLSADCGVIGTPISQARKQHYEMSTPYYKTKLVLLARKGKNISSMTDLFTKVLGVLSGSVAEDAAAKISTQVFGLVTKSLQSNDSLTSELLNDGVDAIITDHLQAKNLISEHQTLHIACEVPESMCEGLDLCVLLPKDSSLKEEVDRIINEMKSDGSLETLQNLWLKPSEGHTQAE